MEDQVELIHKAQHFIAGVAWAFDGYEGFESLVASAKVLAEELAAVN